MTIKWGCGGVVGAEKVFGNRSNACGITSSDLSSLHCLVNAK